MGAKLAPQSVGKVTALLLSEGFPGPFAKLATGEKFKEAPKEGSRA